jgi:hypothetical protein
MYNWHPSRGGKYLRASSTEAMSLAANFLFFLTAAPLALAFALAKAATLMPSTTWAYFFASTTAASTSSWSAHCAMTSSMPATVRIDIEIDFAFERPLGQDLRALWANEGREQIIQEQRQQLHFHLWHVITRYLEEADELL